MKKLIAMLLAVCIVLSLVACGGSKTEAPAANDAPAAPEASVVDTDNSTLRINLASEPDYLDPALNSSVDGACLAVNTFVGLMTYDKDGNVVPGLAESYEVSDDGLVYTFHLRESKWSDGTDLTANDFVYSWNRAANPMTASDYGYLYDGLIAFKADADEEANDILDGVVALDDLTLEVTLVSPCAYFMSLCAFPTFYPVPQAAVEAANPNGDQPGAWCADAGFVSNGAYTCTEWKHDESMVYTKNPYYYDAENVTIEKLEFMLSADDTAIFAAYNAGDLDFIDTVPTDEISNLNGINPEFYIIPNLGTYYVGFNVASEELFGGKTPEQASAMREALSLLIDRDYIVENIAQCGQQLANSFIPAGMADGNGGEFKQNTAAYTFPDAANLGYFDPTAEAYDDNFAKAIELLRVAGYEFNDDNTLSDATPISFTYLTNNTSAHVKIAESIQQDLGAIGIDMSIEQEDWNVFLDDRKAGNFGVAREGWLADFDDPINMLEMWTAASGNNDMQFGRDTKANPNYDVPSYAPQNWKEYDALIAQIKAETDFEARTALMHQAEDMLMETYAVVPLYYYNDLYMQKANVDGMYANAFGYKYFMYCTKG